MNNGRAMGSPTRRGRHLVINYLATLINDVLDPVPN